MSTLREIQSAIDPRVLALLAIAAVFLAVTGPFGTFDVLNLPARLIYWSGVVFFSYGLRYLADMVARRVGLWGWTQRIVAASGFALVLSVAIVVANYLIFGLAISVGAVVTTFMIVVIVSVLIEGVIQLLGGAEDDVAAESGFAKFMQRLPLEKRGTLIRIEAEDHYLRVVTDKGAEMILMRLTDAEAELGPREGMRVHRSHWIVPGAVTASQRYRGQLRLTLQDGVEIPVSRSYQDAVIAAGLI